MTIPTVTIVMAKLTISARKFILLRLGIYVLTTGCESWELPELNQKVAT